MTAENEGHENWRKQYPEFATWLDNHPTPDPSVRVAEIEAREKAATEGPWGWTGDIEDGECSLGGPAAETVLWANGMHTEGYVNVSQADAEFIAAARSDIPWLIERLRATEAETAARDTVIANAKEALQGETAERGMGVFGFMSGQRERARATLSAAPASVLREHDAAVWDEGAWWAYAELTGDLDGRAWLTEADNPHRAGAEQ